MGSSHSKRKAIPKTFAPPPAQPPQTPLAPQREIKVDYSIVLQSFYAENTGPMSALQWASQKGNTKLVQYLLEQTEVDVNYHTTTGEWEPSHSTALRLAVIFGSKPIVEMLLKNGADITIQDTEGNTVLYDAVVNHVPPPPPVAWRPGNTQTVEERRDIVRKLLVYRPDLTLRNNNGYTVLHYTDNNKCRKILLNAGAPINALDNDGYTPLRHAVNKDHEAGVWFLLQRGANPSIKDFKEGLTPLHKAAAMGYLAVAKALIKGGAKVTEENNDGLILVDYIRTISWAGRWSLYLSMTYLLFRASGIPEPKCTDMGRKRCSADRDAYETALRAQNEGKIVEWRTCT